MVSSRKITRRKLFYAIALQFLMPSIPPLSYPQRRKFKIGDRVRFSYISDFPDYSSYELEDFEEGIVMGFCLNYDEWLKKEFKTGWTYFVDFGENNDSSISAQPEIDFAHETEIFLVNKK